MADAQPPIYIPARKRGPKGLFDDPSKLADLAEFLREPGNTTEEAAARFGCSPRTIELTLKKIRDRYKESEGSTRVPEVGNGC